MDKEKRKEQFKKNKKEFQKTCDMVIGRKTMDITESLDDFKKMCNRVLDGANVDRDEARAGVLGYCSFALLVVALDHIKKLEVALDHIKKLERVPTKETLIAMLEAETGKNLTECNSVEELFEKLNRPLG